MNLTVNVFKYKFIPNNSPDGKIQNINPGEPNYVLDDNPGIPNVYITLRYPNGDCISKKTGSTGRVIFTIANNSGECTVYETNTNIGGNHNLQYFDTLEAPQPTMEGLDSNYEVTSTTVRKYNITIGTDNETREFGHTVYKPVDNDKAYFLQKYQYDHDNILREINLETGGQRELKRYRISTSYLRITAFAYNPKEKLLYGINNYETPNLYRIDGDYNIVKVNVDVIKDLTCGDCDNEGNYFISTHKMDVCHKINFNKNSLNYLENVNMNVDMNKYKGNIIYDMNDWKYINPTKKLYSYCRTDSTFIPHRFNMIEISVHNNTLTPKVIDTVQSVDMIRTHSFYGYDNNILYFIESPVYDKVSIYRVDMNSTGTKTMEYVAELKGVFDDGKGRVGGNGANDSSVYSVNNTLTVNVSKYKSNEKTDPIDTEYIKYDTDAGIENVYITVRDRDGFCVSKETGSTGSVDFEITKSGEYTVYETLQNINGYHDESYFDNLVVQQPIIDGSDIYLYKEVTSTTSRKKKITVIGFPGEILAPIEFAHTVYKPVPCSSRGYTIKSLNTSQNPNNYRTNVLLEMNLITNSYNELKRYNTLKKNIGITAFAYNPKEKLLYGIDKANNNELYRIDGDYKIVKLGNSDLIGDMQFGDCDNNGNYITGNNSLDSVYRINLNSNSLNYLNKVKMEVNKTLLADNQSIDRLYDIKYNNNTGQLYTYCRTDSTTTPNKNNIVKILIDFDNNTFTPIVVPTNQLSYENDTDLIMKCCFGTDNGILYFITQNGVVYKTDVSKLEPLVMEKVKELPELLDHSNIFEGNGANCSVSYVYDLGNAPETDILGTAAYKTSPSNRGPIHYINNNIRIGKLVYPEENPIIGETPIDNDGCDGPLVYYYGLNEYLLYVRCYNNTPYPATLYGWLDFNTNGKFEKNEFASAEVLPMDSEQIITLTFTKLQDSNFSNDKRFIRLRLTTDTLEEGTIVGGGDEDPRSLSNVKYINEQGEEKVSFPAKDGEVEDWVIKVGNRPLIVCESTVSSKVAYSGQQIEYKITVSNKSPTPANDVVVRDDLPREFKFVKGHYEHLTTGTKTINSAEELITGVNIGTLDGGEIVNIYIIVEVK